MDRDARSRASPEAGSDDSANVVRSGFEGWALAGIVLVAAALRWHGLGEEPWYDEIWTHLRCTALSFGELAATYDSQNHHILYSLLAKLSLEAFGDSTLALRLPAAAFGVLGIVAVYALGREVASRREGLFAAALLAVAYHHVWFSQNARGYTALACWCAVATWLLLRALADDSRSLWLIYGVAGALAAYTHLTMLCVVAAHAAIVLQVWLLARSRGEPAPGWNALLGFAVLAVLVLALHAPIASQLWEVNTTEGRSGIVGQWSTPAWTAQELAAGLARAFSRALVGGLVLVLAAAGLWRLARRRWIVAELFVVPVLVSGALLLASGHHLWPRFFFFAIGLGALALTSGAFAAGDALARALPRLTGASETTGVALASLLVVASAASLGGVYEPKQRFRAAIDLIESDRGAGATVVVLGGLARVYRDYYGKDWPRVATVAELEAGRSRGRTWLVHTFPLAVRARYPEIQARLDEEFTIVGRFDGTLHGGTVLVWRSKDGPRVAGQGSGDGT
jgi:mannosyltransferase